MKKKKNNICERTQDFEFANDLIERSINLSSYLKSIEGNYKDREDFDINYPFEDIYEMLKLIAWAYPINSKEIPTPDVDRMAPMLIGPLFTSERHPWPKKNGMFLEPLIQFDLEWAGKLGRLCTLRHQQSRRPSPRKPGFAISPRSWASSGRRLAA
ncbi:hypothetical protein [Erythrobacter cryptus]|uniref:hypothetical protein n=1 Tax=Erythrobacter cryptus TaxID=196588 RepID=UPI0012EC08DA|nr:hypothetical protein [Erythrobacter cryptus]